MRILLKILGAFVFSSIFIVVSMKVFAPEKFDEILGLVLKPQSEINEKHVLKIAFAEDLTSMEPTSYTVPNRNRMLNIYESLVSINKDLQVRPALALSWGMIDENVWEFNLRPNVRFHDGTDFDADDVKASFIRAMNYESSDVKNLLSGIKEVKIIDQKKIHIIMNYSDPIILNKLATVFIFPSEFAGDFELQAIGTGPYKFMNLDQNRTFYLEIFIDYWNGLPKYKYAELKYIPDKYKRFSEFMNGKVDILASLPFGFVNDVESFNAGIELRPSLEINFLMFDSVSGENNIFFDKRIRQAVSHVLDRNKIIEFMGEYARPSYQFVSSGIFGYSQNLEKVEFDLKKADDLVKEVESFERLSATLDIVEGLDSFAYYIKNQLNEIGIDLVVKFLPPEELQKKIIEGKSNFFFMGWRSELGDIADFYQAMVHSRDESGRYGQFNGGFYENQNVDRLIESSEEVFEDLEARSAKLQEIMKIITNEDIMGIPLFEAEILFGVVEGFKWEPRVDGYVLAFEVN